MKVSLCVSISVNGFIAKENGDTGFVSDTEWKSFRSMVKNTGNIIVGRKTYEIMKSGNEFRDLDNVKIVVVTSNDTIRTDDPDYFIVKSPQDAIKLLKEKGFKEILVAGGGMLNSSFIKNNLIDDIYLDIEPIVFGKGIKLFSDSDFESRLKFVGVKNISDDEIQLHYNVLK